MYIMKRKKYKENIKFKFLDINIFNIKIFILFNKLGDWGLHKNFI